MRKGKVFDFLDSECSLFVVVRFPDLPDFSFFFFVLSASTFKKALLKVPSDIGKKVEYFLSTGNLVTNTGLDLQQARFFFFVCPLFSGVSLQLMCWFACVIRPLVIASLLRS